MTDVVALAALVAFPDTLRQRVAELTEQQTRFKPAPTEWSVAEIVGHYADIDGLYTERFQAMLEQDNPTLAAIDPDAVVIAQDYQHQPMMALLNAFAAKRNELVAFVRVLSDEQMARTGIHPSRGTISIADGVGILVGHDDNHMRQIEANIGG